MITRRIAQTAMIALLSATMMGSTQPPPAPGSSCLLDNYDLLAFLTRSSRGDEMSVKFESTGKKPVPAFGFKVAIYRWLAGNKAYSTNYFSINFAGQIDANLIQVAPTDCYTKRDYNFNLQEVRRQYPGQKILVKIVYDPPIKDANNTNHIPTMSFVLE